jgi:class I lanthipeptide synthase
VADLAASPAVPDASTNAAGNWQPILTGDLAQHARRAVAAVDDDLSRRADRLVCDPSISSGSAGLALFYAYLSQVNTTSAAEDKALDWLERSITQMCRQSLAPALHGGYCGVAWTLAHVSTAEDRVDDEQFTLVDEGLAERLEPPTAGEYDLINGLVGIGVYALERLPSPAATTCLRRVIDHLDRTAVHRPSGTCWWTPVERIPPIQRNQHPEGYANLGVAHGVPGAIGLLAQAVAKGVAVEQSRRLLSGAVEWLLAQQLPNHPAGRFGYTAGDHSELSRLAWCYGDLGIAAVLLSAARAADNASWEREAVQIARLAAQRTLANSAVQDAGLCHGAAGIGHLFNRLYQTTGQAELLDAARRWFEVTLQLRSTQRGVGGFSAWETRTPQGGRWADEAGFLEGAAGVALALLAATSAVEPNWDRVLLCSLPLPA